MRWPRSFCQFSILSLLVLVFVASTLFSHFASGERNFRLIRNKVRSLQIGEARESIHESLFAEPPSESTVESDFWFWQDTWNLQNGHSIGIIYNKINGELRYQCYVIDGVELGQNR